MNKEDIICVRRVKDQLINQVRNDLVAEKLAGYKNWIKNHHLEECDFTFTLVDTDSNDYEDNYVFEMLFECKYKVGIHFTYSQYTNVKNYMSEYINEIHPRKNIHAESHRLKVINAIRSDPRSAYKVTCSNADLLKQICVEEIVKEKLFNL